MCKHPSSVLKAIVTDGITTAAAAHDDSPQANPERDYLIVGTASANAPWHRESVSPQITSKDSYAADADDDAFVAGGDAVALSVLQNWRCLRKSSLLSNRSL